MASFSNPYKTYAKDKLSIGFINPGSLRDRLPRQSSTRESKNNRAKCGPATDRKVWPKKSNARSSTTSAHLSDRSARFGLQPPSDGLSNRKACPEQSSGSDPASLRPGYVRTLLAALLRPAQPKPTRAIRPGTPARKEPGTNGESST